MELWVNTSCHVTCARCCCHGDGEPTPSADWSSCRWTGALRRESSPRRSRSRPPRRSWTSPRCRTGRDEFNMCSFAVAAILTQGDLGCKRSSQCLPTGSVDILLTESEWMIGGWWWTHALTSEPGQKSYSPDPRLSSAAETPPPAGRRAVTSSPMIWQQALLPEYSINKINK